MALSSSAAIRVSDCNEDEGDVLCYFISEPPPVVFFRQTAEARLIKSPEFLPHIDDVDSRLVERWRKFCLPWLLYHHLSTAGHTRSEALGQKRIVNF